jgi:hypothetical protein
MTFFQNPFASEFRGSWVLGDRQHSLTFTCPANTGRSDELVAAWNQPNLTNSYNLSGNDSEGSPKSILTFRITISGDFKIWTNLSIDITDNQFANLSPAPNSSSINPYEIVAILNANPTFASYFTASLEKFNSANPANKVVIKQKFPSTRMRYFVVNGGAEEVLGFNSRAGVSELPSYFKRYKVYGGNMDYPMDGTNSVVELDTENNVDANVINDAVDFRGNLLGLDSGSAKEDWQLVEGRASGLFTFQKITVDGSDRITQIIEYPAGAVAGDFARKINYTYTSSNMNPDKVTEIPYVLAEGDLVTP